RPHGKRLCAAAPTLADDNTFRISRLVQIDLDPKFCLAMSDSCATSAKLFVLLQLRYIVEVGAPIKSVWREPGPNLRPHPPTPQLRLGPAHTKLTNLLPIIAADFLKEG